MKTIIAIIKADLQGLKTNMIAAVVVLGLIFIPPMYAWLTTLGFWDPYNNTGNIAVVVANEDEGYQSNLLPTKINAGAQIVSALHENKQFNWQFMNKDQAIEAVRSGAAYAAFVIPKDFSKDLTTAFSSHAQRPKIEYYTNQKSNAIATHVTAEGANRLEAQIDNSFTDTVAQISIDLTKNLSDYLAGDGIIEYANVLSAQLDNVDEQLNMSIDQAESFADLLQISSDLVATSQEILKETNNMATDANTLMDESQEKLAAATAKLEGLTEKANDALADGSIDPELEGKIKDHINALMADLKAIQSDSNKIEGVLNSASASASKSASSLMTSIKNAEDSVNQTIKLLKRAQSQVQSTQSKLEAALNSHDLEQIRTIIGNNPDSLATFLSAPTELVEHKLYEMATNGDSMSSFYSSLSLWIGAIFLVALTQVNVSRSRIETLHNPKAWQLYLGRYGIFALVALAQALVLGVGNVFLVGVQCENLALYLLSLCVCAIVFSNLVYTLTISFGNIGKAAAIIALVMQLAGTGGIMPIQMSAPIFQDIYPWLPFTYSIEAFAGCIAGFYGDQFAVAMGALGVWLACSLAFGLFLRVPLIKVNEFIARKLEETKFL